MKRDHIKFLILNEISSEYKNKNTLGAILLYVISTTFVAYISFKTIDDPLVWNALFWIMILFASINTISGSFKESFSQSAYLFTLVKPQEIIMAKIMYNSLLLLLVSLLCLFFYSLFIGNYISNFPVFFSVSILGSLCLSSILTLSAGIAYKAAGNTSLFSILSIPIVIPVLVLLITSSNASLTNTSFKSFFYSEMYPGQSMNIKATLLAKQKNYCTFMDEEEKERNIYGITENLNINDSYLLLGTYNLQRNAFQIKEIEPIKNKIYSSDYLKIGSLLLITILMIGIGYLVFPKFWTD